MLSMPREALPGEAVLESLRAIRGEDPDWENGSVFGYVYKGVAGDTGAAHTIAEAHKMFLWDNALNPAEFPSALRLESDVISICAHHLGGDEQVTGNITSGGTESVLLALKTARDWARATRPVDGIPEVILPVTAHPCAHKACDYFGLKAVVIPVKEDSLTADPANVRAALSENTIALFGSATNFAFGTVDPITELGAIALEKNLWLHVDGCIGAFLLPLFEELGGTITPFDFRVPGVTSMSMDLHKYALTPKGASVVLFKSPEYREPGIFTYSQWPGYAVINPTMQSTRPVANLASAWATFHAIGREGYLDYARELRDATKQYVEGIESIEGLRILGKPEVSLAAYTSDTMNVFAIGEALKKRGWLVGAAPGPFDIPASIHITIMPLNIPRIGELVEATKEACEEAAGYAPSPGLANIEALLKDNPEALASLPADQLLAMVGMGGGDLPEDLTDINTLMNMLPNPLVDRLLQSFFNTWSSGAIAKSGDTPTSST